MVILSIALVDFTLRNVPMLRQLTAWQESTSDLLLQSSVRIFPGFGADRTRSSCVRRRAFRAVWPSNTRSFKDAPSLSTRSSHYNGSSEC